MMVAFWKTKVNIIKFIYSPWTNATLKGHCTEKMKVSNMVDIKLVKHYQVAISLYATLCHILLCIAYINHATSEPDASSWWKTA